MLAMPNMKVLLCWVSILLMTSCNYSTEGSPTVVAGFGYESGSSTGSLYSGGGRGSAVERFYDRMIDEDRELAKLDEALEEQKKDARTALEALNTYESQSKRYREDVDRHIYQIKNAELRAKVSAIFERLDATYTTDLKQLKVVQQQLEQLRASLVDEHIALKLRIARKAIAQYHKEQLPAIDELKATTAKAESLLKRVQQYEAR